MRETNRNRLLWAGFMAIFAAGAGFAIRGGIFDNWAGEYGFTGAQLGAIGGGGFSGFCFGIIIGGVVADKIGYGKLVALAFACHVLSAFVTFAPGAESTPANAFNFLFWGMFIFGYANGTLEAVANPLIATLFPENRTHYLNILHASWPAGMMVGAVIGWVLDDKVGMHWKYQLAIYLVPTVIYGLMFLRQKFPKSEAFEKGLKLGEMFKDVGILGGLVVCFLLSMFLSDVIRPLLANDGASAEQIASAGNIANIIGYTIGFGFLLIIGVITRFSLGAALLFALFIAHALVGAVELGTDGWIQNITGNILTSEQGKILFVWTSTVMFGLRFCAHLIESKLRLSPVGILLVCSILTAVGLNFVSRVTTFMGAMVALTVYAVGKTFLWPTMLAVTSDRFPRTGAVAISIMGGIGTLAAALLGSTGLGYAKDHFSGRALENANPAYYQEAKAEVTSRFLWMESTGLDGRKLSAAQERLKGEGGGTDADKALHEASITGDRRTLIVDSFIPAAMAIIYLSIMLYFKSIGGYKPVHIDNDG